jgi:hypothetical protein
VIGCDVSGQRRIIIARISDLGSRPDGYIFIYIQNLGYSFAIVVEEFANEEFGGVYEKVYCSSLRLRFNGSKETFVATVVVVKSVELELAGDGDETARDNLR